MSDTLGSSSGLSGIPPLWKLALAIPLSPVQFERGAALTSPSSSAICHVLSLPTFLNCLLIHLANNINS